MESIHIYHTNDLHSHLKRWPRIHRFLTDQRSSHTMQGEEYFLFDIGDFIDRWHPLSEGTAGKGNIELLNESLYDAVTIGNNEGVNFPFEALNQLYDDAKFDVLVANLYKKTNTHPDWLKPYKIFQTNKGTRLGVIGVTAHFQHLYHLLGWKLTEPIAELKKWIPLLKEKSDVIIVLSHLGLPHDEKIAVECPEVDVILGGHTHHTLPDGKPVGHTLLAGAGKHGKFVGHVTLSVDANKNLLSKEAQLFDVLDIGAPQNERNISKELFRKGKKQLKQEIVTLKQPLEHDPFQVTELSSILCSALREWCKADCAFINAGLLLGSLSGKVTKFDLLTICPHPINPCKIRLTGRELEELLLETQEESWSMRKVAGLGFRGTVVGVSVYDGITFKDSFIYINETLLDPNQSYTIAIPDMFTFGHFFTNVLSDKEKDYFLPEFLRDILSWKLGK
jgi:5'-nucleotidase